MQKPLELNIKKIKQINYHQHRKSEMVNYNTKHMMTPVTIRTNRSKALFENIHHKKL